MTSASLKKRIAIVKERMYVEGYLPRASSGFVHEESEESVEGEERFNRKKKSSKMKLIV